ncbi:hypothetical protein QJS66_04870 [Kocuria rhizophila]|nr:hypothetical protein QJS66_04870 [Kocuria rhizophila]
MLSFRRGSAPPSSVARPAPSAPVTGRPAGRRRAPHGRVAAASGLVRARTCPPLRRIYAL